MWSVPLVASIAIIGALAAFLVLASPGAILAQDGSSPTLCEQWADIQGDDANDRQARADFRLNNPNFDPGSCAATGGNGNGSMDAQDSPVEDLDVEYKETEIVVSWSAVEDAASYMVRYGQCTDATETCGDYTGSMPVNADADGALATSVTIPGTALNAGTQHQIGVTAYNAAGSVLAQSSLICPAEAPTDFAVVALDNGGRLTWEKPQGAHAGEIVGYQIKREVYHENTAIRNLLVRNGGNARFYAIGMEQMHWDLGLSYGATYTYQVRAKMEVPVTDSATIVGYGLWSRERTVIVADSGGRLDPIPVKPGMPQNVSAKFNRATPDTMCVGNNIVVSWMAPDRPGREGADSDGNYVGGDFIGGDNAGRVILGKPATIKYYNVLRREGGSGAWMKLTGTSADNPPLPAVTRSFTDNNVEFGKSYEYRVEVTNSAPLSNYAMIEVDTPAGAAKPADPGVPTSLIVTVLGDGTIELQWDPPAEGQIEASAGLLSYEIRRQPKGGDAESWKDLSPQDHEPSADDVTVVRTQEYGDNLAVTGAELGQVLTYQVRAVLKAEADACVTSESAWVEADSNVEAPNVPAQVTGLMTVGTPMQTQVSLSWMAPDARGAAITGYTLERQDGGTGDFMPVQGYDGTSLSHMDTGLTAGTTYKYRVSAANQLGSGDWSVELEVITASAAAVLSRPTNVEATADGNTVTVTWTDGMNAGQHGVVLVDSNGEYENDWLSRHETDGTVTFMNIPSGTYLVIVASISADFSDMKFAEDTVTVP